MARRRGKLKRPQLIGQILSESGPSRRGGSLISIYQLRKSWRGLVGETLAQRTAPKMIQNQTLVVSVENSAWSHHLSMMKDELFPMISEKLGQKFSDIRFVNEPVHQVPTVSEAPAQKPKLQVAANPDETLSDILARIQERVISSRKRP